MVLKSQFKIRLGLFVLSAIAIGLSNQSYGENSWGCYDPKPGHPKIEEKIDFVDDVSNSALKTEKKYGVPAPAIAAMSIIESGYGFTRTALEANNLFGYKWTNASSAQGRTFYELTCQPSWDPGNRYIKFEDRETAIDFVASRLASSPYYSGDTAAFKAAILKGQDRKSAIIAWLIGISDPYNYQPQKYAQSIIRIMNDPIEPSQTENASRTLFNLK